MIRSLPSSQLCTFLVLLMITIAVTSNTGRRTLASKTMTQTTTQGTSPLYDEFVQLHEFQSLELNCSGVSSISTVSWTKDGKNLVNASLSEHKVITKAGTSKLLFEKANVTDIGNYECRQDAMARRFSVRAKPRVKFNITMFKRSESVVVSGTWTLNCEFVSHYYALDAEISLVRCENDPTNDPGWCGRPSLKKLQEDTQHWVKTNTPRVILESQPSLNGTVVSLTIKAAHYQDIAYYTCVGKNWLAKSKTAMLLRVRDKTDFVWPSVLFIGLAFFLVSLVAIFETRRIQATSFLKLEWDKIN